MDHFRESHDTQTHRPEKEILTSINNANPLSQMLNNAFAKFDKDGDGKPGIANDEQGKPTVDYSERMDPDGDGLVSQDEMNTTGLLKPAALCDPTLNQCSTTFFSEPIPRRWRLRLYSRTKPTIPDGRRERLFHSRSLSDFRSIYP
ncbi:hypothetical protein OE766_22490 [Pararhizobium sp. YC-54]|uniref:hypothetical protein n=1 Tax=Pararhizobium sp. YC-54 TaxID=2986920 RepID=UPI0021F7DAEE|nr:hypothetical protein [Pararhizobium sp. YC-54]MCW0001006.1 hypothetical protein [Pararhizobium sp. YC-54]